MVPLVWALRSADLGGGRPCVPLSDGLIGVLEAQARVDGDCGCDARPGGRRNKRSRVGAVAGGVDAVDARGLACIDRYRTIGTQFAAQRERDVGAQLPA